MGADLHKVFDRHTIFCIDVSESTDAGLLAELESIHLLHNPIVMVGFPSSTSGYSQFSKRSFTIISHAKMRKREDRRWPALALSITKGLFGGWVDHPVTFDAFDSVKIDIVGRNAI
jgi:hypothetical protein